MRHCRRLFAKLNNLFRRSHAERELTREVSAHLALLEDEFQSRGMSLDEARIEARRAYGGVEQAKQLHREERSILWLEQTFADLRFACRSLLKAPGFTTVAVLTLALGIGANIAIFTVVNAVLLRPLPFQHPERLVRVFDDLNGAGAKDVGMSEPEFEDLRDRSGAFDNISVLFPGSTALSGGDHTERIEGLSTSPDYFQLLGAQAELGRVYGLRDTQPGFSDAVVISEGLWKRQFGGDPQILGRRIRADEDGYTIVGVMPPDFRHPGRTLTADVELWTACGFAADPLPSPPVRAQSLLPGAIARLKPGLTIQQAQQHLDALAAQLAQSYPKEYPASSGWSLRLEPVEQTLTGSVRPTLVVLLAAVGFVLLMVAVNMASLLVARSSARMRELAIRQALGASRARLVRQLLTESALLSLIGGSAAMLVLALRVAARADAGRSTPSLGGTLRCPSGGPSLCTLARHGNSVRLDPGIARLQHGSESRSERGYQGWHFQPAAEPFSKRSGGHRDRLVCSVAERRGTPSAQFLEYPPSESRFRSEWPDAGSHLDSLSNNPAMNRYRTAPAIAGLSREILRRVRALPGIEEAAMGGDDSVPLVTNTRNQNAFSLPDQPDSAVKQRSAEFASVSPEFFQVLRTRLLRGRFFTEADTDKSKRVVIVNESFAKQYLRGHDLGQRLHSRARTQVPDIDVDWEIVGVVGDVRDDGLDKPVAPRFYRPLCQARANEMAIFLRGASDSSGLKQAVTGIVQAVDPDLPVYGVRTMREMMATSLARRRFSLSLMAVFGALALFLASIGIYGVMAYAVSQRAQEFRIRMALGALPRDILLLSLRPGAILTLTGVALGLAAAQGATHLMASLLFGVSPSDPMTFVGVPIALAPVALLACWIPARRATRVDPLMALRQE